MASTIIHLCVAKEINKVLKKDESKLFIGSIAPDLGKLVFIGKGMSHFSDKENEDIPVLEYFLNKYKKYLNDDFVLGYYIHLYTDYLWFKFFLSEIIDKNVIKKLDGTNILFNNSKDILAKYVYNDYTNLNISLINEYNLDYSLFFKDVPRIDNIIDEIPIDKIGLLFDKSIEIIENSKKEKEYIFDIAHVKKFIELSTNIILGDLKEKNII